MDEERPKQPSSVIRDFTGMYSDVQPTVIPKGGMETQVNCFSMRTGELVTRGGLIDVTLTFVTE